LKRGFGIYIHWPFCQAKCPYCDFNSHVSATIDEGRWKSAYLSELSRAHSETSNHIVTSVFFGGGTPSLMSAELVDAVISKIRRLWRTSNDLEITLEANPTSSEAQKFRLFSDAGVNRLSMGIQALNNVDLKKLGRLHTVEEAQAAFDHAREAFERVSFDLIYARQNQSISDWEAELKVATKMAVDHLSLYQLTIEPGTAFGARFDSGKLAGLPTDDLSADMYEITQSVTEAAGLVSYETSNHARPNCESRHNLIYWRGGDYLGIGPGAHGRLTLGSTRLATTTTLEPITWLRSVETAGTGELTRSKIDPADQMAEYVMMSMRLAEGMDLDALSNFPNHDGVLENITRIKELGYIRTENNRAIVQPEYRILLNAVLRELLV
jgi:oxygen-independent coproporphyrinogen-3 oxidase